MNVAAERSAMEPGELEQIYLAFGLPSLLYHRRATDRRHRLLLEGTHVPGVEKRVATFTSFSFLDYTRACPLRLDILRRIRQ